MAQDDEPVSKFLFGVFVTALVVLSCALFLAVVRASPQLLAWWVIIVFQVLLTAVAIVTAFLVCAFLLEHTLGSFVERLTELERDHADVLRSLKRQTPSILAAALLVGQAAMLVADKTFDGKATPTLVVSVTLLIGFWLSNEFQHSVRGGVVIVGWALWLIVLAFLPLTVMLFHGWGPRDLLDYIWRFDVATRAFWGLALVLLVMVPLLTLSRQ